MPLGTFFGFSFSAPTRRLGLMPEVASDLVSEVPFLRMGTIKFHSNRVIYNLVLKPCITLENEPAKKRKKVFSFLSSYFLHQTKTTFRWFQFSTSLACGMKQIGALVNILYIYNAHS